MYYFLSCLCTRQNNRAVEKSLWYEKHQSNFRWIHKQIRYRAAVSVLTRGVYCRPLVFPLQEILRQRRRPKEVRVLFSRKAEKEFYLTAKCGNFLTVESGDERQTICIRFNENKERRKVIAERKTRKHDLVSLRDDNVEQILSKDLQESGFSKCLFITAYLNFFTPFVTKKLKKYAQ